MTFIYIYQNIFINKKQFLFNVKNKNEGIVFYFELTLLSIISLLEYLDYLIQVPIVYLNSK